MTVGSAAPGMRNCSVPTNSSFSMTSVNVALTGEVTLDAIDAAVRERFAGVVGERNAAAVKASFDFVTLSTEEMAHASPD